VRWEKFLKHSGRIVCRQSQSVSFCQDVKVRFSDVCFFGVLSFFRLAYNVLQLQEVGDFGDENCLPPLNLIRSTKLHLSTEPPISCRCCYKPFLFPSALFSCSIKLSGVYVTLAKFFVINSVSTICPLLNLRILSRQISFFL
jgi:hypothetical protein